MVCASNVNVQSSCIVGIIACSDNPLRYLPLGADSKKLTYSLFFNIDARNLPSVYFPLKGE
jgi:hypothetical protein